MPFAETFALRCQLSRGGFSSERVFRVRAVNGAQFIGVAPPEYCFTEQGKPIGPDEPAPGTSMPGLVTARKVRTAADGTLLVSVPDGSVVSVRPELLIRRPTPSISIAVRFE